jgi:hypothetical protein
VTETETEVRDLEASLTDDERAMLDDLAEGLARRRLTTAALFFLESHRPLAFVTSQVMVFFQPVVQILWRDPKRWEQVQSVLSKRGSIELLLRRLEAQS